MFAIVAVLAIAGAVDTAAATEPGERRLTFGGFGTLAAVTHNESGFEFRRSVDQAEGAKAGEVDLDIDTLLGMQLNAAWSRQLEAVVQGVTREQSDGGWRPRFTRAFLRYQPNEDLMLRVGRVGYELVPRTDSRDIGYSYVSMRAPVELLGILPRDDFDGADITLTQPIGRGVGHLKIYGGRTGGDIAYADNVVDIDNSKIWGAHLEYLVDDWVFRLGSGNFLTGQAAPVDALVGGLRAAAAATGTAQAAAVADRIDQRERRTAFTVLGAVYDHGPLQARLTLARAYSGGPPGPKIYLGSALASYSFGKWTPFAAYAFSDSVAHVDPTGLPEAPPFLALNRGARDVQTRQQYEQDTVSMGLRYDIAPKVDLKLQVDRIWVHGPSLYLDRDHPKQEDRDIAVFGLGLDFIF